MGCFDDTFSAMLKIAWDNYLKKCDRLIFVVCGSVSTWIRDNIIGNKAFYGRRSLDIVVPELPLAECVNFWGDKASRLAEREITQVIERVLNDAEQVCEKMYQTPNGTYQSHIAIRISKKELANKMATALSDDQKLEGMFHRDQFRKWAEEYMKKMKGED